MTPLIMPAAGAAAGVLVRSTTSTIGLIVVMIPSTAPAPLCTNAGQIAPTEYAVVLQTTLHAALPNCACWPNGLNHFDDNILKFKTLSSTAHQLGHPALHVQELSSKF